MPKLSHAAMDERRSHILQAAGTCFSRSGFRSTTIADIRRESGVSTGAIYTYFSNKDAIVQALLEEARELRGRQLAEAMGAGKQDGDGAELLLQWVEAIFGSHGRQAARVDVNLWAEALHNPTVGKLARDALNTARAAVSQLVAAKLAASNGRTQVDAKAVTSVLIAIFLGLEVQTAVGVKLKPKAVARALAWLFEAHLPEGLGLRAAEVARKSSPRAR